MKNFLKLVNWKYLAKYELGAFFIIMLLYLASNNKFPDKIWYAILLFIGWTLLMFMSAFSSYILNKNVTNQNDSTYNKEKSRYGCK